MSALLALAVTGPMFFGIDTDRTVRENRKKVYAYSDCVVKKHGADAEAAVLSVTDNATLVKTYPKILDEYCFTGFTDSMSFPADLLRFGLADALYRKEFVREPVLDPASIAPLAHRDPAPTPLILAGRDKAGDKKAYSRELFWLSVAVAYSQLSRMGECVIRANPASARAVLQTYPTSDDETITMRSLNSSLGACLDTGNKMHLTKEALRGAIALNYYRMSKSRQLAPQVKE